MGNTIHHVMSGRFILHHTVDGRSIALVEFLVFYLIICNILYTNSITSAFLFVRQISDPLKETRKNYNLFIWNTKTTVSTILSFTGVWETTVFFAFDKTVFFPDTQCGVSLSTKNI